MPMGHPMATEYNCQFSDKSVNMAAVQNLHGVQEGEIVWFTNGKMAYVDMVRQSPLGCLEGIWFSGYGWKEAYQVKSSQVKSSQVKFI